MYSQAEYAWQSASLENLERIQLKPAIPIAPQDLLKIIPGFVWLPAQMIVGVIQSRSSVNLA